MAGKFTDDLSAQFVERFRAGVSLEDACRDLEMRPQTVKNWLSRGRKEPDGTYGPFAAAVDEAREQAKAEEPPMDADELARVVSRAARKGSVAAMKLRDEMLERERLREADEAPVEKDPLAFMDNVRDLRPA